MKKIGTTPNALSAFRTALEEQFTKVRVWQEDRHVFAEIDGLQLCGDDPKKRIRKLPVSVRDRNSDRDEQAARRLLSRTISSHLNRGGSLVFNEQGREGLWRWDGEGFIKVSDYSSTESSLHPKDEPQLQPQLKP